MSQDALVQSLMNRFKEFCRDKKPRVTPSRQKEATNATVRQTTKSPGITKSPSEPSIMPGEDDVSYKRHTKLLQVIVKVKECMQFVN